MAVDIDVAMDMDVAVLGMAMAVVGVAMVGIVVGLCMVVVVVWAWAHGGRKMGGGGVRRLNVQCSKFNKVELWHVMLKPSTSRECVAREGMQEEGT